MKISKDENTLYLNCAVPTRSFNLLPIAIASGKIKHASITETKIKWRKGEIYRINLSTKMNKIKIGISPLKVSF